MISVEWVLGIFIGGLVLFLIGLYFTARWLYRKEGK